jgi:hypothetical protein
MTEAETKWAQVDKELLGIVWGLERLDNFVFGRKVRVKTDHKPLVGLVKRPLPHLTTRQQRLVGRLMHYDLDIEFTPGSELVVPDYLSRATANDDHRCRCTMLGTDIRIEEAYVSLIETTQLSPELEATVRQAVYEDLEYTAAIGAYGASWPPERKTSVGEYWGGREFLVAEDDLLFFQGRVVIPKPARRRILESLHRGHVALHMMKKRAEAAVWWPGLIPQLKA